MFKILIYLILVDGDVKALQYSDEVKTYDECIENLDSRAQDIADFINNYNAEIKSWVIDCAKTEKI